MCLLSRAKRHGRDIKIRGARRSERAAEVAVAERSSVVAVSERSSEEVVAPSVPEREIGKFHLLNT